MTLISYAKPRSDTALAAAASTPPYSVTMINKSASPWIFYAYQAVPNEQSANMFSLVWFCSPYLMYPDTFITFEWTVDYNFVWGATGAISPGVTFSAGGYIAADPQSANTTIFSATPGPTLSPAAPGSPQGSLAISDAATVPNNTFLVGTGMGNVGTLVMAAGPNLRYVFPVPTPPNYWIAAGTNLKVGTILDVTTIAQNLQVTFPVNVYAVTCTLGTDNKWTRSQ
jgi:rhizosphere induced protein